MLALARIPTPEDLRYEAPGEWGKILGLDRLPEVKTRQGKLGLRSADAQQVYPWSNQLAQEWMAAEPESVGTLYIDGPVRVYHGSLTALPRRYVARQKLCLRGTTEYWVNAMDGQPFFVVTQAADPGLIQVLEDSIVPRLLKEVPGQPTAEQLQANLRLARFTVVFDRATYSPEFFRRLHRLAFPCHDQALQHLGDELTATETTYPGTDLRLVYQFIGATPIPGSQVV